MKKRLIVFAALLSALFSACVDDKKSVIPEIVIDETTSTTVEMSYKPGVASSFAFNSTVGWTAESSSAEDLSVSPSSGKAGNSSVNIKMLTANQTSEERSFTVTIKPDGAEPTANCTVTIKQPAVFVLQKAVYNIRPDGGELQVVFETPLDQAEVTCWYDNGFVQMLGEEDEEESRAAEWHSRTLPFTRAGNRLALTVDIVPNNTGRVREGILFFAEKNVPQSKLDDPASLVSEIITITQNPIDFGQTTDYSADGEVFTLQTHSKGEVGIPIVIMGEAFIDTDISDGTYRAVMEDAMEKLFTIEPMTSLREYFDVYMVNAVSPSSIVSSTTSTAFSCSFTPQSTLITGDDKKCEKYALKAIDKERKHDALVLVIINDKRYAGTCSLTLTSDTKGAVASGLSIAYIPTVEDGSGVTYERVLHHEAVGHGLGKLDDEYGSEETYKHNGNILEDETEDEDGNTPLDNLKLMQKYYGLLNVTLEKDVMDSPWSDFAQDVRYIPEKLGTYEGASAYPYGIYRPTDNSLMRSGSQLNAVGRRLIYRRVMSIAHAYEWRYNYEDFVKFDEPARAATKAVQPIQPKPLRKHHAAPRIKLER